VASEFPSEHLREPARSPRSVGRSPDRQSAGRGIERRPKRHLAWWRRVLFRFFSNELCALWFCCSGSGRDDGGRFVRGRGGGVYCAGWVGWGLRFLLKEKKRDGCGAGFSKSPSVGHGTWPSSPRRGTEQGFYVPEKKAKRQTPRKPASNDQAAARARSTGTAHQSSRTSSHKGERHETRTQEQPRPRRHGCQRHGQQTETSGAGKGTTRGRRTTGARNRATSRARTAGDRDTAAPPKRNGPGPEPAPAPRRDMGGRTAKQLAGADLLRGCCCVCLCRRLLSVLGSACVCLRVRRLRFLYHARSKAQRPARRLPAPSARAGPDSPFLCHCVVSLPGARVLVRLSVSLGVVVSRGRLPLRVLVSSLPVARRRLSRVVLRVGQLFVRRLLLPGMMYIVCVGCLSFTVALHCLLRSVLPHVSFLVVLLLRSSSRLTVSLVLGSFPTVAL